MSVNGVNNQPWYCGWLIPCKNESEEKAAKTQPKIPTLPLTACAPTEGDYDVCDGQSLKVSVAGPNPSEDYPVYKDGTVVKSKIPADQFDKVAHLFADPKVENLAFKSNITEEEINKCAVPETTKAILRQAQDTRPNVAWQLSVKDCQNKPVNNVTAQCDFDGDGNYDDEAEFVSKQDASTITVSQKVSTDTPNPINCIVSNKDGNDGTVDIYPPYNAQKPQTEAVKTQCDYAQDKPTISAAYLDSSSSVDKNGNIVFGSDITIVVGAKSCDENQDELEVFVSIGPYNKIPMEKGEDGLYRATLKVTTTLSNPVTILVSDNAKGTYTEEARYFIPNTVSANSSADLLSCEATDNKPNIQSGLTIIAGVDGNNKVVKGDPVTFAVALEDCDKDNSDVEVTLFIGDDSIVLLDDGNGTYSADVPAANWGPPLTAYVTKNGVITQELQLWNLPIVVSTDEPEQTLCEELANKPKIVSGLSVTAGVPENGKVEIGQPVTFEVAVEDCDADNSDLTVELHAGGNIYSMVSSAGTTYSATVPATYWGAPITAVITKQVGEDTITVTSELWNAPTVIPKTGETIPTPQASIIAPFSAPIDTPVSIYAGAVDEENFTYEWNYGISPSGTVDATGANPPLPIFSQSASLVISLTVRSIVDPNIKDVNTHNITIYTPED